MVKNKRIYFISDKNTELASDFDSEKPADFETAISATGFGKFNLLYLLLTIPSAWSTQFESTTMSYVFPAAQCDLNLTLQDKGNLNAITYIGMITSALIWGYLSDTLGRKKLLIIGYLLNGLFVLLAGFSQTLPMILFAKFMSGFIICGPYVILTTALSEFHCMKYRTKVMMIMGSMFGCANIVIPLIAWAILPTSINLFLSENIVLNSWNVLIFVSALPSLISGFGQMLFPESPKFLMTTGRNDEALKVFQQIYSLNTGKLPDTFPIKVLVDEVKQQNENVQNHGGSMTANRTKIQALKEGFQQIQPLFFPPYLKHLILVCTIQLGITGGVNTLKLWLPQIFQAINDYLEDHPNSNADLCVMLSVQTKTNLTEECTFNIDNDSVYLNAIIVAFFSVLFYVIVGSIVNCVGKKAILFTLGVSSGCCGLGLYFAKNSISVLTLTSIVNSFSGICVNTLVVVVVDLFPTSLRTMTVSLIMMVGRTGAVLGNLVFPGLLSLGCLPPFLAIGGVTLLCSILTIALPKTDLKALV